ncbi:MAG: SEC-C domain-containing protein [Oligoflexia bacterium]|nr:SEC-C domain-containing protein [Oligoflexia bacterium]
MIPITNPNKIGVNAKCPCGSGKKYKKCCIGKDISELNSNQKSLDYNNDEHQD